ncbi:allantoate amidohydrolase [Pelagibius litoralis]|uniref:Allantoate amidohydrolase n=1 Tax=Pelagibius litoralis TaxID=374515 RepID=A0A967C4L5_9PROT|nr:allantoate amidohydrolase [Pelagibius litoralis]NIA68695.1 allantoate amidohydrolase [Pelagibius litoralis]
MTTTAIIDSLAGTGASIKAMVDDWARFSEAPDKLTRVFLSAEHKACAEAVIAAMEQAGMTVRIDAIGNVVGRYEGATPDAKTLVTGSHIDTVRDAGAYDGNLGVALPIACVADLNARGKRLPFAVEIIAFGDEEGVRFPTTLSGSRAVAGTVDPAILTLRDSEGTSLAEALRHFGCDPDRIADEARKPEDILAFVELHIEQGPVLEAEGLPVGVVTAINGASRFALSLEGMAGHAGTVPMHLRKDALSGAAEMIGAVERLGQSEDGLVATVGRIAAGPGAVNVIPGRVDFTLDIRAPEDGQREAAMAALQTTLAEIAVRRHLKLTVERLYDEGAVACDPALMTEMDKAIERQGIRVHRLPSGAGHDAMALATLCPIAMFFLRCGGGISHNPLESITAEDTEIGARVFLDFLEHLDPAVLSR